MKQFRDDVRHDPYNGKFNAVQEELHKVLSSHFSGAVSDAMHLGSAALTALRIVTGDYNVSETSFKLTTRADE